MREPTSQLGARTASSLFGPMILLVVVVLGCSVYANLSFLYKSPSDWRFFPPFERGVNRNHNRHLGAEYYNIARALTAGRGFSDPFRERRRLPADPTAEPPQPTAWMAPALAWILAGLHWLAAGDEDAIVALAVLLQNLSLIAAGLLVVALARQTTGRTWIPVLLFAGALLFTFRLSFQFTHDCWLVLLTLVTLMAGLVWYRPFESSWTRAILWGVFGGLCALVGPVCGFTWGMLAIANGVQRGRRLRFGVAVLLSIVTISPWVIRNYLVFGRLIPVKSNLAYELYQSQVLQDGGVLRNPIFASHPYVSNNKERRDYAAMGEMEFLDQKKKLFSDSVRENPGGFIERIANRFFAATLVYVPFNLDEDERSPKIFVLSRIVFPLPFLSLAFLVTLGIFRPLSRAHWVAIGVYLSYLLPYVLVSYYERYKYPLLAAEVLLVFWAADKLILTPLRPVWSWIRSPRALADEEPIVEVVEDEEVVVEEESKESPVPVSGRSAERGAS